VRNVIGRRRILVAALLAMAAGATRAEAIVIIGGKTGSFGLAAGQTARISVLHTGAGRVGGITPCVGVFDLAGTRLAELEADAPVLPGQGVFLDFDAGRLGLRAGQRAQLRVEVEVNPTPDDGRRLRADDAIVTLEVFDNESGKTTFVLPVVLKGFNPQPEPPARVH
jgi:hypothetical protein